MTSRLVDDLVARGWVHRHATGDDGRGVVLELTDGEVGEGPHGSARGGGRAGLRRRVD